MDLLTYFNTIYQLDAPAQEALVRVAKRRVLPKGAELLHGGDVADAIHFIEKGLVRGFYYNDNKDTTSWIIGEGSIIWPLPSYLLKQPSRESIQLLEPSTLLSISRQDVDELKQSYGVFRDIECRLMERYITLYDMRIQLLLMKASKRLDAYRQVFPDIHQRVPLRYIATYLGIDPATLSRLRSSYKHKS